jgi:hypothetical protein
MHAGDRKGASFCWRTIRFALALPAITACAQTLTITPASVDRGTSNIFRILLKPAPNQALTALQWELAIPPGLRVDVSDIVASSAAESSEKTIACAIRRDQPPVTIACLMAGGRRPLSEGAVAIVKFAAAANAHRGPFAVRVQKALGVSIDLKKIPIADSTATITIR